MNQQNLETIKKTAETELSLVKEIKDLENWRIKYLGRKSELFSILHTLGKLPPERRAEIGKQANEIKDLLFNLYKEKEKKLKLIPPEEKEFFDFTLPGYPYQPGHIHPLTQIFNEITNLFTSLGFAIAEGPEIETDYYNFEALNIPQGHPARDMQDSFYIQSPITNHQSPNEYLLRTHTSPVQIRIMEKNKPPLRIIAPGRVFRREAVDASHSAVFHQVEGFAVDKRVTFADLKGTLNFFVQGMFGKGVKARFRPSYFPFVEPGVEVDISCLFCSPRTFTQNNMSVSGLNEHRLLTSSKAKVQGKGKGCRVCKHSGYLELLGAGMIHPNVFKAVGYPPKEYTGFAFGIGVERIAMLKYGIDDMRLFYTNDLRFLTQF